MDTAWVVLGILAGLALGVALLFGVVVTLGFSGEAHRHRATRLHAALLRGTLFVAIVPVPLSLWVGWRYVFSERGLEGVPLTWGLPMAASVGCAAVAALFFFAGEWLAGRESEKRLEAERRALAALRAAVVQGAREKACLLVASDPRATADDMRRCREHVDSLSEPTRRWSELSRFLGDSGFRSWNPWQVGLSPVWDWNRSVVVVRHEQAWFLQVFYETWLARPDALQSSDELEQLSACLRTSTRRHGWSVSAVEVLMSQVLPELLWKLEARGDLSQSEALARVREQLAAFRTRSAEEEGPPPPSVTEVPEGTIGLAEIRADGVLRLWLRSTPDAGAFGDVYLEYQPFEAEHRQWMGHLGSMTQGVVKPVPPMKVPRSLAA
ncbi:hypothetical protein [Myxococcus sp. CA040A]|uniref:hypothetical protein n=1 Tax=Myxococcus sp. CA040A TaxID=2741738 RepID=UPI00157BB299|nr:hypothetical protein [Myxococcus sp. CA040A]NTX00642.1 hypothetical protein [Myxococcus sp. CA040A]